MKRHIVSVNTELHRVVPMHDMPQYSIGIIEGSSPYAGTPVIRGFGPHVTALDGSASWKWRPIDVTALPRVRLLPPGTKIEIEVGV